jgi:N-acetylneuraminic acid mutarotase
MLSNWLASWWRNGVRGCQERFTRLRLESLEERWVPVTITANPVALTQPVAAGTYSGPVDSFTDSRGATAVATDFAAVINWGDRTATSAGTVVSQGSGQFEVIGSHTYHEGSYLPTVTITDTVAGVVAVAGCAPDSWTSNVAAMPIARYEFAAVTGPDGRIYAIGGLDSSGAALNSLEAYNPATNTWATLASMPTSRSGLAAAVGPDGRIYAIGGFNVSSGSLNTVEAYNPATNTWATLASMPTSRSGLAAAVGPDGRIYAIGGFNVSSGDLNTVEAYDVGGNAWTGISSMSTARTALAAALGPDGHIYAVGGAAPGSALSTVEAYNLVSGWSTVASMPSPRSLLAAVLGPDGRIYAVGGFNGGFVSTVEAYAPAANTWTTLAPLSSLRSGLTAVAGSDGRIYAIGGSNGTRILNTVEALSFHPLHVLHGSITAGPISATLTQGKTFTGPLTTFTTNNTLEQAGAFTATIDWGDGSAPSGGTISGGSGHFSVRGSHTYSAGVGNYPIQVTISDSAGDQATAAGQFAWSSAAPMPTARLLLATVTGPDGRIYALGGQPNTGSNNLSTLEAYDPAANTWTTLASMPTPRAALAAVMGPNGLLYALGGGNSSGILNTVEAYNPATNTWTTAASMPTARDYLTAAVGTDGRIYAIGGFNGSAVSTVEAYDPTTNTWTTVAPMASARYGMAAVAGPDGRIYAVGGFNGTSYLSTVEAYDPISNAWSTVAPMTSVRWEPAVTLGDDGRIYAIGGGNNTNFLNTVEAYDPVANSWSLVASLPAALEDAGAACALDGRIYLAGGISNGTAPLNTVSVLQPSPVPVTDPPLTLHSATVAAAAGIPFTGTLASFSDADASAVAAGFTAVLSWGDGTAPVTVTASSGSIVASGTGFLIQGAHTYAHFGSYTMSIQLTDGEGQTVSGASTVNVFPAVQPPLQPLSATATDGSVYKLSTAGVLTRTVGTKATTFDATPDRFVVSGTTVYDLENDGHLIAFKNGTSSPTTLLDLDVVSFGVETSGAVDMLEADGTLRQYQSGSLALVPLDTNVATLVMANGTPVVLDRDGRVRVASAGLPLLAANIVSIAGDGTTPNVYALGGDGALREYPVSGGPPAPVDTGVASFRIAADGTVTDLHFNGTLEQGTVGGSFSILCPSVKSYGLASDGSVFYLTTAGTLFHGSTQESTRINSFALAADGSVYSLSSAGAVVRRRTAGTSTLVTSGARALAVTDPGNPEVLLASGILETMTAAGKLTTTDTNVQAFIQTANSRYDLHLGGSLQTFSSDGKATVGTGISAILLEPDGFTLQTTGPGGVTGTVNDLAANLVDSSDTVLFRQEANGRLWQGTSGGWTLLDTTALAIALDSSGVLYELQTSGTLRSLTDGTWAILDTGVNSLALAADNTLVYLQTNGALWALGSTDWTLLDNNVVSFTLNGTVLTAHETSGTLRQLVV